MNKKSFLIPHDPQKDYCMSQLRFHRIPLGPFIATLEDGRSVVVSVKRLTRVLGVDSRTDTGCREVDEGSIAELGFGSTIKEALAV